MRILWNRGVAFSVVILCLAQGCTTTGGFSKFYQQEAFQDYPPTRNVRVYRFTQDGLRELLSQGYIVLGQSNFNGPYANQNQAIAQAKRIGAEVVLLQYTHAGTRHGSLPMTQYHAPQTATIHSRGYATGSAYGSGGYAYGNVSSYGTTHVTSPGYTTTQFVPIAIERYEHLAIYLRQTTETSQNSTDPKRSSSDAKNDEDISVADLLEKGFKNLSQKERDEWPWLSQDDPRYGELKEKAISTLPAEEQEAITAWEKQCGFEL